MFPLHEAVTYSGIDMGIIPEGVEFLADLRIGGETLDQLKARLALGGQQVDIHATTMLESRDFAISPELKIIRLVRVRILDLGLTGCPTTDQIYAKAASFGLELCPAEVGPYLCLAYKNKPLFYYVCVGMNPILDDLSNPSIFELVHLPSNLCLTSRSAYPDLLWRLEESFVFSVSPTGTHSDMLT